MSTRLDKRIYQIVFTGKFNLALIYDIWPLENEKKKLNNTVFKRLTNLH